jgi:hypothetical protein
MLIFSPKFVIEQFLGISFNRIAVKQLAGLAGKTERTVYSWFSKEKIPKRSEFYRIIDQIDTVFEGKYVGVAYPTNSRELIRVFKNPDWSVFAAGQLSQDDNVFRETFAEILKRCRFNEVEAEDDNQYLLRSYLPKELIDNVYGKFDDEELESAGEKIKGILEFSALLYYLSLAEAEYLISIKEETSTLAKKLPRWIDKEKGLIQTPVEIFFKDWLFMLIKVGIYDSKKDIAEELEDWCELEEALSANREINRIENEGHCPSWKTFNEWVVGLLPPEFEGQKVNQESELLHAQNVFGGTRILDKSFRKFAANYYGPFDPVDFFQKVYPHYFKHHMTSLKKGADPKARPS